MADRGSKRKCQACGAPYYDLNRTPIVCPKCGAVYEPMAAVATRTPRPRPLPLPVAREEVEYEEVEEAAEVEPVEDGFEETEDLPADDETFVPPDDEDEERE